MLLSGSIVWADPATGGTNAPTDSSGHGFSQRSSSMRDQLLAQNHGTPATEAAVLKALRWLKELQSPNGSWDNSAMTALSVLCFLGHGDTPKSAEFGKTVSQGIHYLVSCVKGNGIVKSSNRSTSDMYAQGIVTLALSEAYGMTQSAAISGEQPSSLRSTVEKCIHAIIQSQNVHKSDPAYIGGWRYKPESDDADMSVTGWLVMALKSASLAGLEVPREACEKASHFVWNMYAKNTGGFGYMAPGQGFATTAIGILCQQSLGKGDDIRLQKSLATYNHTTDRKSVV